MYIITGTLFLMWKSGCGDVNETNYDVGHASCHHHQNKKVHKIYLEYYSTRSIFSYLVTILKRTHGKNVRWYLNNNFCSTRLPTGHEQYSKSIQLNCVGLKSRRWRWRMCSPRPGAATPRTRTDTSSSSATSTRSVLSPCPPWASPRVQSFPLTSVGLLYLTYEFSSHPVFSVGYLLSSVAGAYLGFCRGDAHFWLTYPPPPHKQPFRLGGSDAQGGGDAQGGRGDAQGGGGCTGGEGGCTGVGGMHRGGRGDARASCASPPGYAPAPLAYEVSSHPFSSVGLLMSWVLILCLPWAYLRVLSFSLSSVGFIHEVRL